MRPMAISSASWPSPLSDPTPFGNKAELLAITQRMLIFTAPLTALVLSDPLLLWCTSLFVGQCCPVTELAALGPGNIVIGEDLMVIGEDFTHSLAWMGLHGVMCLMMHGTKSQFPP